MSTDEPKENYKPELRHLGRSIDDLLPQLWKTDTSSQLGQLLNIVAQARTLGDEGFDLVMGLAEKLRSLRAFDDLYVLTSEMNAVGLVTRKSQLYEIQALIELGVFETALDLVRPLLVDDLERTSLRGEAYGHLGRIYKQMYVNAATGQKHVEDEVKRLYVERSFNAYMHVWDKLRDDVGAYHGVNALAMAHLAARKGYTQKDPQLPEMARAIIKVVEGQDGDVWAKAKLGEALLALEDYDAATKAYAEFADHKDVTPFTIGSTLRQVIEIWELNGGDEKAGKPVRLLKAGMLAKLAAFARFERLSPRDASKVTALEVRLLPEEVSQIEADLKAKLPPDSANQAARDMEILKNATPEEMEHLVGINKPISQRIVLRKLERSASVCRIETRINGEWKGVGTGFAVDGALLNPEWNWPVIVTNNHVVSTGGCVYSHKPDSSRAAFARADEAEKYAELGDVLWESEHTAHDITVISLKSGLPAGTSALTSLSGSPLGEKATDDNGIGSCYLIGYPFGAELCFSLSDNILLDHDGPTGVVFEERDGRQVCIDAPATPVRLHYRTPTTRGSSGSPVFDAVGIELIGVHHAGRPDMTRLNNRGGCYAANEGIWIQSIAKAIESDASVTALEAAFITERAHSLGSPTAPPAHSHDVPLIGVPLSGGSAGSIVGAEAFKGSPGNSKPGVSAAARELIFKPGRADPEDVEAARLGLETVIGRDNRTRVTDTEMSPWRMICSIRVTRGGLTNVGTGFMIGPSTLLTAGHVLVSPDNPNVPTQVQVIPGLNGERMPYRSHTAERFTVHPKWSREFSPACDVAMIHLGQNLGCETGWFRVSARDSAEMVSHWVHVTGYPGEKKEARGQDPSQRLPRQACQLWHHAAPIERFDVGRVFYRVDTTEGQSGAPIYVLDEDLNYTTPTVVGIHAYGTRGTPGSRPPANSGVWFNPAILDFIAKNLNG